MKVCAAEAWMVPLLLLRLGADRSKALADRACGDPLAAIRHNIERSRLTWAGLDLEGVVVMGGAIPQNDGSAYVWQFLSGAVRDNKRGYLAMSRKMVAEGLQRFSRLLTLVEAGNTAALRHCRRMGWSIGEPQMIEGIMAHRCEIARHG